MEQEPGSSGAAVIDRYARGVLQGYDFMGVSSTGSKVERARNASAAAQMGNVFITHNCRNMLPFLDECDLFPFGIHDDTVDGFSGAFNYFRPSSVARVPSGIKKTGGSYWTKFRR